MDTLHVILLVISIILAGISGYLFYLNIGKNKDIKKLSSQVSKLSQNYDFDQDIQFLQFIMSDKIQRYKLFVIRPLYSLNERKIVKDEELNKIVEELVYEIIQSLSDDYTKALHKYYTNDALQEYITETVFTELTSEVVSINHRRINRERVDINENT